MNTITNTVHNLVLGMALNKRSIYGAIIKDTIDNENSFDIIFKTKDYWHTQCLLKEVEDMEAKELLSRAFKMPRKRMAVRATFVK